MSNQNWNIAKAKTIQKIFSEFLYEEYLKEDAYYLEEIPGCWQKRFKEWRLNRVKNMNTKWKYCMLTINFKEGIMLEIIKKKTEKALSKKWIKSLEWRYECRGKDGDNWTGVHVHAWIQFEDGKNPYRARGEFYNSVKDAVGNKKHVNCKYSNNPEAFKKYVAGYKNGNRKTLYSLDIELNTLINKLIT